MLKGIYGFRDEYSWLSNFYPVEITYWDITYPSVEAAYQASKTLDPKVQSMFTSVKSGEEAKRLGKGVVLRKDWDYVKLDIMLELTRLKYKNERLRKLLLDTGINYIEETNTWYDTYWGVYNNNGLNMLGKIIMKVRDEIRDNVGVSTNSTFEVCS